MTMQSVDIQARIMNDSLSSCKCPCQSVFKQLVLLSVLIHLVCCQLVWSSSSFFHILISHFVTVTLFVMSQPNFGVTDGQAVAQGRPQSKRLQQTQAQVDEVVGIMKVNVEKVLERDAKLSQLDDRADALQEGASQFEKSAATLKRKYWWKNCKMIIIICAIVLIIIIIIVVWVSTSN
ncbi:Synaptobrevin-1 [Trichinella pseudospiralis]|uniref:Synaptobrevin-1 n=1 Tax=Trichinella pseudospiralis TaxID=6337 RepID=A0A0V1HWD5_TRIPS|nr:Synaptobrevin-1 [Trichinella pseudospiralis]KRZ15096.1 Synaptobrevin-1 [Trichinella pseudospiralis]